MQLIILKQSPAYTKNENKYKFSIFYTIRRTEILSNFCRINTPCTRARVYLKTRADGKKADAV